MTTVHHRSLPLDSIRARFPGLARRVDGRPALFCDGPGGSQVPRVVADAVRDYLLHSNANTGGAFATARETDAMLDATRTACADFLGTTDRDGVVFGPNMTTLTFALARSLAREWQAGDRIVVTSLDHDANITPWTRAAASAGAEVIEVGIDAERCTLDEGSFERALKGHPRLVALGAASNLVGTINPVATLTERAKAAGAEVFVDAVHYAPHRAIDVEGWGCDYVACSPYKFFGPHLGVLWGRSQRMATLPVHKVRPASDATPHRWMTGTQSHEAIAGTAAAIEYIADLGREVSGEDLARRAALEAAFAAIAAHERSLGERLLSGLQEMPGWRVWGLADPAEAGARTPTVGVTTRDVSPPEVAQRLADRGVFVWPGHSYAMRLAEVLGREQGVVRAGLLHYNTLDEVERLLDELRRIAQ